MKWLQYQINRNSLFTNYKVNKFKSHISPNCSFCSHIEGVSHLELVSHLFWECDFALKLWLEVKNWLQTNFNVCIPLDRKILLFGFHDQPSGSVNNFIILSVKYFIWKAKFQSSELCFLAFQKFLKFKLEDLKNAYVYEGKDHQFQPWSLIYDYLSRIQCTGTSEALLPPSSPTSLAPVLV